MELAPRPFEPPRVCRGYLPRLALRLRPRLSAPELTARALAGAACLAATFFARASLGSARVRRRRGSRFGPSAFFPRSCLTWMRSTPRVGACVCAQAAQSRRAPAPERLAMVERAGLLHPADTSPNFRADRRRTTCAPEAGRRWQEDFEIADPNACQRQQDRHRDFLPSAGEVIGPSTFRCPWRAEARAGRGPLRAYGWTATSSSRRDRRGSIELQLIESRLTAPRTLAPITRERAGAPSLRVWR